MAQTDWQACLNFMFVQTLSVVNWGVYLLNFVQLFAPFSAQFKHFCENSIDNEEKIFLLING